MSTPTLRENEVEEMLIRLSLDYPISIRHGKYHRRTMCWRGRILTFRRQAFLALERILKANGAAVSYEDLFDAMASQRLAYRHSRHYTYRVSGILGELRKEFRRVFPDTTVIESSGGGTKWAPDPE